MLMAAGWVPAGDGELSDEDETRTVAERFGDTADGAAGGSKAALARGDDVLDRYAILDELGSGGMGVVYSAFDRKLDRKVALKILRRDRAGTGQQRMLAEAQALARLSHPNVVEVFDVGTFRGRVYIAMEYIDGVTLGDWAKARRRTWRDTVEVLLAAARGLAAAHAAGLVHRDFKPSNVLVGTGHDGARRVRVVDFGIAIVKRDVDDSLLSRTGSGSGVAEPLAMASDVHLTETGAVMGTPAYMAPEQHLGEPTDERSDQFSFCVAAYRVLYGERPFAGRTARQTRREVLAGRVRPKPAKSDVPRAVRRVLLRGLSRQRSRRFASVAALADALRRSRERSSRLLLVSAASLSLAGYLAYAGLHEGDPQCASPAQRLGDAWDDTRKAEIGQAFGASELTYAPDTLSRVTARLDAYAADWVDAYTAVCAAGAGGDPAAFDAKMSCLRRRGAQLSALTGTFAEADETVVERAATAVASLAPVTECMDADTAQVAWDVPQDKRAGVEEVQRQLAVFDANHAAGRLAKATEIARAALARADELDVPPLSVEARWRLGIALAFGGDLDQGVRELTAAAHDATAARHDRGAAHAATRAAFMIGYRQANYDEALTWARYAEAAVERSGSDPTLRADLYEAVGAIEMGRGEFAAAEDAFTKGLKIRREELGAEDHKTASMHNNLGGALLSLRRAAEGAEHVRAAIEIWTRLQGPDHPNLAVTLNSLAVMYDAAGDLEQARRTHLESIAIKQRVLGPEHDSMAVSLDNLGSVLVRLGEVEEGREYSERALRIRERNLGREHPHVASSLVNLALADEKAGRLDDAQREAERARRIFETALGPDHPFLAYPLTTLGRLALGRGEVAAARTLLAQADARRGPESSAVEKGETRFALAQAIHADGDAAEALSRARKIVAELEDEPGGAQLRAQVHAWLDAHRGDE